MSTVDRAPRWQRPGRRSFGLWLTAGLIPLVALVACGGDGGGQADEIREERDAPNPGAIPTIPGGVELTGLDPAVVLVGSGLAFGAPLPSEQAAADAFTADPEVSAALARRVFVATEARRLADLRVLVLDGTQLFDESVLAAFERGAVGAVGGGPPAEVELAGRPVLRAASAAGGTTLGFREGNLLVIVSGATDADVELTVTRQLEAIARGEVGTLAPATPLVGLPVDAAFVPVATVTFAPIPPPEEEPAPVAPGVPGATGLQGRYGVVAGERRTVVWAFTVDPGTYPTGEALEPVMQALAAERAAGATPQAIETIDRVVQSATNPDGAPSARVFRHQGLVLLVEGDRADQLDAVTTAWITALGPG